MTLVPKWKRAFLFQCDNCGAISPPAFFKVDALAAALAAGWRLGNYLVPQLDEPDLCPFCVKALDDEDAYQDYRDERGERDAVLAGVG